MNTGFLIKILPIIAMKSTILSAKSEKNVTLDIALTPSPCQMDADPVYGGVRINCQFQSISSLPLPQHWLSAKTSALLLGYNSLTTLTLDAFTPVHLYSGSLRFLSLTGNRIASIDRDAFSQLTFLKDLDLSNNKLNLDQKSLNGEAFRGLNQLTELQLGNNDNHDGAGVYNDSLFNDLRELVVLSLDTFYGDLNFGKLFQNTQKLATLSINGGFTRITNSSFETFHSIKLRNLILNGKEFVKTESEAFQYLKYLECFDIQRSKQGLAVTLESLGPFVPRNMSLIALRHIHIPFNQFYYAPFLQNTVISLQMARYLSKICVENFVLSHTLLLILETGVITNSLWRRCLKSVKILKIPLMGEKSEAWRLMTLHNLEHFELVDRKNFWITYNSKVWIPSSCDHESLKTSLKLGPVQVGDTGTVSFHANDTNRIRRNIREHNLKAIIDHAYEIPFHPTRVENSYAKTKQPHIIDIRSNVAIFLPPKLRILIMDAVSDNYFNVNGRFLFHGGDNLIELHMADNGISYFTGALLGLKALKVLDVSLNDGSIMTSDFFDSLPSIAHLNMATMKLGVDFMANNSKRLFHNLSELKTLILSENDLRYLSEDTFANNTHLSFLSLKGNRFRSIPFDVRHVPNLCHLDMRGNSIKKISDSDITSLENHFRIRNSFSLLLSGNEFSCDCDSIRFLSWLQSTLIDLDSEKNYSCLTFLEERTSTSQFNDLNALWRKCNGQKAFSISICLLSFMTIAYGCILIFPKFKTQLKAFVLKAFWAPVMMKSSKDYPIGVYIGYADQDINLACYKLRPFIEENLQLTTYIRHRDLLPASDMAESIMESIHSSWRVLLVVSGYFLQDQWSYYALKAATLSVQTDNPGRLVLVLVTESDERVVLSKLPNSVLQTVKEESIIFISSTGRISYEEKQALKTSLRL